MIGGIGLIMRSPNDAGAGDEKGAVGCGIIEFWLGVGSAIGSGDDVGAEVDTGCAGNLKV